MDLKHPHRRRNPLTGDWVLVSPQRTERPWQGHTEDIQADSLPAYDPQCYLCPGNERARGDRNPHYTTTFVFENDFAALKSETSNELPLAGDLFRAEGEPGICRVVCFSPRHDLTIARMQLPELRHVVDTWTDQFTELGSIPFIHWVQVFENRGAMMGASNPHPHGQVWANANLPNEALKESVAQIAYGRKHHSCLLCDYLQLEQKQNERLICENQSFQVLVPFWALWPFETLIISKRHITGLDTLTNTERGDLAEILKFATTRYDNLFRTPFPYTMGFHQRPTDGELHDEWHLHAHFYPPLLRSASVRKFMVGYEMLASPQRDITPEAAAERLRALPVQHYLS